MTEPTPPPAIKAAAVPSLDRYVRLERRLVLLAWLNDLFGFESNRDLLEHISDAREGFDATGRSYVSRHLESRGIDCRVAVTDLRRYDENLHRHLSAVNFPRPQRISLRYFQYLSVLYTEIFLDRFFSDRSALLSALNHFVKQRNSASLSSDTKFDQFTEKDLRKLALWMATGSGKTLIMHINYKQFLHHNCDALDNILLVTPNRGLSLQHLGEMHSSGIPCKMFDLDDGGLMYGEENVVQVIEITKFVEDKKSGGVSVPVEAFEGKNLLFVDEGHKGTGGDVWRHFRDAIGAGGFTFEYSATFGQALTASKHNALTAEYGKSIIFDYSYRYFHGDGFGKDFSILNLKGEIASEATNTLVMGNLLSFYEQHKFFSDQTSAIRSYNLAKPLWVFVGSTVNAVFVRGGRPQSDVLTVLQFIHRFLRDRLQSISIIDEIIRGQTGLFTPDGRDLFEDKLGYLRSISNSAESIYDHILVELFHTPSGGSLHLSEIKSSVGEIALKAGSPSRYFGLVYIGDTSMFKKLVQEDSAGIILEQDVISQSVFERIDDSDSPICILVGAKKFMEGWNSWRVSSMGLLNIGRSEGSEIIQLFGRGVRLKGLSLSLKRSSALRGTHPPDIRLLETLNIFAVRANYMAQFRAYLENEGIETERQVEWPLVIRPNKEFLEKGLVVPRVSEDRVFQEEEDLILQLDSRIEIEVDLAVRAEEFESRDSGVTGVTVRGGKRLNLSEFHLGMVDWERIYLELAEYRDQQSLYNLVILPQSLQSIFGGISYVLITDESVGNPKSFGEAHVIQDAVVSVLREYVDHYYRSHRERWYADRMTYKSIDADDSNFRNYVITASRNNLDLIREIESLLDQADDIYRKDRLKLPTIYFDRHLYQPLLVDHDRVKSSPIGLNRGERRFVEDLRQYCVDEKFGKLQKSEIYLLRNLSRGRGVGFFDGRGFYPDFILWIKSGNAQRIIFIEPHGMVHAKAYEHDSKARLHEALAQLSVVLRDRTKIQGVSLDSFVISATDFHDLKGRYGDGTWDLGRFAEAHIVFFERTLKYDYLDVILGY